VASQVSKFQPVPTARI